MLYYSIYKLYCSCEIFTRISSSFRSYTQKSKQNLYKLIVVEKYLLIFHEENIQVINIIIIYTIDEVFRLSNRWIIIVHVDKQTKYLIIMLITLFHKYVE